MGQCVLGIGDRFLSLLQIGRIPGAHMPGGTGRSADILFYIPADGGQSVRQRLRHRPGRAHGGTHLEPEAANLFLPDPGAIGWMVKQNPKGESKMAVVINTDLCIVGQYPRRMDVGISIAGGTYCRDGAQ